MLKNVQLDFPITYYIIYIVYIMNFVISNIKKKSDR